MRIEPDRIRFECVHTECTFAQSGLIWIVQLCVRTKKGMACMLVSTTDSKRAFSGLHTVFHVSTQLEKQYDGGLK